MIANKESSAANLTRILRKFIFMVLMFHMHIHDK